MRFPPRASGAEQSRQATLELQPGPSSVASARRAVREALSPGAPAPAIEDVELVVSELVTNALKHAPGSCKVWVEQAGDGCIRGEVVDGSPEPPVQHDPDLEATNGRGLWLVDALTSSWGHRTTNGTGKAVWFERWPTSSTRPSG